MNNNITDLKNIITIWLGSTDQISQGTRSLCVLVRPTACGDSGRSNALRIRPFCHPTAPEVEYNISDISNYTSRNVSCALNSTSEFAQVSIMQFVRFYVVILISLADARIVQVLAQHIQIPAPSEWYIYI